MNCRNWIVAAVASAWLANGVLAQSYGQAPPAPKSAATQTNKQVADQPYHGLSNWITYERPDCCGPIGTSMPILTEFYLRVGPSFPIGSQFLGEKLDTGWMIAVGARAMFYNQPQTAAWAVDLHIANLNHHAKDLDVFLLPNTGTVVTPREYNRTFVGLGLGRERYLWGAAHSEGSTWRVGWDGGGRWGSASAKLRGSKHVTDVIGGVYAGIHTDLEIPWGCCIFIAGIRGEWEYTWSDILQRTSDAQDANLLFNFGVRY